MLDALLERFHQGDRIALGRLISLLARGEQADTILARLGPPPPDRHTRVVALTGSAGVGKSTLAGKLIEAIRARGLTVAVLACDPQSPLSGGALLGDRFRMPSRPDDDGVFIRSLAAPGGRGALAEHLDDLIRLLETFGFHLVLVETVGAGQGDTTVHELADVVVLLVQPESGDDLQWEKAGVLEVADIVAVHKADLPGAGGVESQVQAMLALGGKEPPPVLRVSSRTGSGITELVDAILALPLRGHTRTGSETLLKLAQETLAARFARAIADSDPELHDLVGRWQRGEVSPALAARALLRLLAAREASP